MNEMPERGALTQTVQNVVIVNGSADILDMLETAARRRSLRRRLRRESSRACVFADQARAAEPRRSCACRIDDMDGFQVLSMLKLDEDTRVHSGAHLHDQVESASDEEEASEPSDAEMLFVGTKPPAMLMN